MKLQDLFALLLVACCTIFFFTSLLFLPDDEQQQPSDTISDTPSEKNARKKGKGQSGRKNNERTPEHRIAGLSCAKYGGPDDETAKEMVYWSDIPSDAEYISPFKDRTGGVTRYITFQKDGGGWNNIRMGMETCVALAHAMGRTLVMPPEQSMYLLDKGKEKHKNTFAFEDFFHFNSLAEEHEGIDMITMEEFLKREAMTGKLKDKKTGLVSFPPHNRTNWNGANSWTSNELMDWLEQVTYVSRWNCAKCVAAFPAAPGEKDVISLKKFRKKLFKYGEQKLEEVEDRREAGVPLAVDAPAIDRLVEQLTVDRDGLCIYDKEMQEAPVIHFLGEDKYDTRLLAHFYTFLFFEDWRQDLWTKRFIRDHVRYNDQLQCAAARIVQAIRERARSKDPDTNPDGSYDSFHIRRGDFQFTETRIEASEIYENSKDELTEGGIVYIATDERDKTFFAPLEKHYDVYYLDNFKHLIKDLNTNYYGMLDQLIASRSRVFFGSKYSTFSGYINRMRGYHADKQKLEGFEIGAINSYYYTPKEFKTQMRKHYPLTTPLWGSEFPVGWRGINEGIDELWT